MYLQDAACKNTSSHICASAQNPKYRMILRESTSTVLLDWHLIDTVRLTGKEGESQGQCILGMDKRKIVNNGIQTAEWTCVSEVASRYITLADF
jgi:hypothetical protein